MCRVVGGKVVLGGICVWVYYFGCAIATGYDVTVGGRRPPPYWAPVRTCASLGANTGASGGTTIKNWGLYGVDLMEGICVENRFTDVKSASLSPQRRVGDLGVAVSIQSI